MSFTSEERISGFVNTLGARLAPLYGIMIVDYYWVKRQRLKVADFYSNDPREACHHSKGWNRTALIAFAIGAAFSVTTVWVTALCDLSGCAWLLGALLGGVIYRVLTPKAV